MTLLFGTSLRSDSEEPAVVAALLAARMNVPLRLVHVSQDPRAPFVLGTDEEQLLGTIREDLDRQAERLQTATRAVVHPHLTSGSIVRALASLSEFELATAIVVGATTRRFRRTAERLCRISPVPVIVLEEAARLSSWLRGQRSLRILVGADLGRTAEAARAFAAQLAALGPSEVEVAMVASPESSHARLGLDPPADRDLSSEAVVALERDLARAAPENEEATIQVISGRGRADAHLVARADQEDFDLVVVGQRGRDFSAGEWRRSVGRGVLNAAPVSVACVPLPPGEVDASFQPPRVVVVGMKSPDDDARVLAFALGHAVQGAAVHVARVVTPLEGSSELRQAREDAYYELSRLQPGRVAKHSITVHRHVLEGVPADQLLALAERVGANLLVLGVRKRGPLERALMGSVARAVLEDSRFPMLLVPERSS